MSLLVSTSELRGEHMSRTLHAQFWLSLLSVALILVFTGCQALSGSSDAALARGNWALAATSSNPAVGTIRVGGNLSQSGRTLSGSMYVVGSLCFDVSQPLSFTGTVKGKQVTLTSATVSGQVLRVALTVTSSSAMSGTYTITGGCGDGDSGSVDAHAVPSISGTWKGSVTGSGGSNVDLSIALTQAKTASADGSFPLTGTLAYTGSTCSVSGTITSAFVAGTYIQLSGTTVETDGSDGTVLYNNVLLDSSSAPRNMTGNYEIDWGLCSGDFQTLTLSKQ
jgi:hypothetical protein